MIPEWMAIALLSMPCTSNVAHVGNVTTVSMCSLPSVQGPPRPPIWWRPGMFDKAEPTKVEKPKYVYKPVQKKKHKKKRKKRNG